ncbi:hypothetical protein HDU67_002037 [Dinochytrium kinnereticum]|nr:hypothetical protein HDU67_002037 [Dinochytrium kinnereticum]
MSAGAAMQLQAAFSQHQQQQFQQHQQQQHHQRFPRRHSTAETFSGTNASGGYTKRTDAMTAAYQHAGWDGNADVYGNGLGTGGAAGLAREASYAALLHSQHAQLMGAHQSLPPPMMDQMPSVPGTKTPTSASFPRNYSSQRHTSFSGPSTTSSLSGPLSPSQTYMDSSPQAFFGGSSAPSATAANAFAAYGISSLQQQQQQQLSQASAAAAAAATAFAAAQQQLHHQQQQMQALDATAMMQSALQHPGMLLQQQQFPQQAASRPGPNSKQQHRRRAFSSDATLGMLGPAPNSHPPHANFPANAIVPPSNTSPTSSTASSPSGRSNGIAITGMNGSVMNPNAAAMHYGQHPMAINNGPLSPKSRSIAMAAAANAGVAAGQRMKDAGGLRNPLSPQRGPTNAGLMMMMAAPAAEGMTGGVDEGPSNGGRKVDREQKKVNLYKTELCRSWEETGDCRYGTKCQFAHSQDELRIVDRHPKYKTQMCKTFWDKGTCPYGKRCCFIHTSSNRGATDSLGNLLSPVDESTLIFGDPDLVFGGHYYDNPSAASSGSSTPTPSQQQQHQQQQQSASVPTTPTSASLVPPAGFGGPRRVSLERSMPLLPPPLPATSTSQQQQQQQQLIMESFALHSVPEEEDDDGPTVPQSVTTNVERLMLEKLRISPPVLPSPSPPSSGPVAGSLPNGGAVKKPPLGRLAGTVGSLPRLNGISAFHPVQQQQPSQLEEGASAPPHSPFAGTPYPFSAGGSVSNGGGYFDFGTAVSSGMSLGSSVSTPLASVADVSSLLVSTSAPSPTDGFPASSGNRRTRSVTQPIRMYGSLPRDSTSSSFGTTMGGPLSPVMTPSSFSSYEAFVPLIPPSSSSSSSSSALSMSIASQSLAVGSPPRGGGGNGERKVGVVGERRPSAPVVGTGAVGGGLVGREDEFENHLMAFRRLG